MEGEGGRRFCADCRREVLDFARMTPREILAHLEASRGRLCARLTRREGRLAVAERQGEPIPQSTVPPRPRLSAVAATLVGAWLGAVAAEGHAAAAPGGLHSSRDEADRADAPGRVATPAPRAALHGAVTTDDGKPLPGTAVVARSALDGSEWRAVARADGSFRFAALPAGLYDLEGRLAGYALALARSITLQRGEETRVDLTAVASVDTVTVGALVATAEPLRRLFEGSELVVTATAGPSVVVASDGDLVELVTELRIESRLEGAAPAPVIAYRHSEYLSEDTVGDWRPDPARGARVLAFLAAADDAAGWRGRTFESADRVRGVKTLGDAERAAYVERIGALARMERDAERRGELDPADLVEWLVATAEEPATRGEVTGELRLAANAVRELAARDGVAGDVAAADLRVVVDRFRAEGGRLGLELRPEVVGAFLTAEHRDRLTAALVATRRVGEAELALVSVVLAWNAEAAKAWLARWLLEEPAPGDLDAMWWLASLGEELDDPALDAFMPSALERWHEIQALWPGDDSEETSRLREEQLAAVRRDIRHRFAAALAAVP
jgi:hypothetical protein